MLLEVVNNQGFCKAIYKHISTSDLFKHKFIIIDQLSNIIVLNMDIFSLGLVFGIFGENNTGLVVFI